MRIEYTEIKEAMNILYEISGDKEVVQLEELRDKAIRDLKSRLSGAKEGEKIEGKGEMLIMKLTRKFKFIPEEYKEKLIKISEETIEAIALDIFEIENIEDLNKYGL